MRGALLGERLLSHRLKICLNMGRGCSPPTPTRQRRRPELFRPARVQACWCRSCGTLARGPLPPETLHLRSGCTAASSRRRYFSTPSHSEKPPWLPLLFAARRRRRLSSGARGPAAARLGCRFRVSGTSARAPAASTPVPSRSTIELGKQPALATAASHATEPQPNPLPRC